jgi:hypothetical protein
MIWVMEPSGNGPCCFILWSLPSEYNIIQRAIISDEIVWPLPDMLELECSVCPLSLFGITSYQAGVRERIPRVFENIEK